MIMGPPQKRQSTYSQPFREVQQSCQIKTGVPPGSVTPGRWQGSCANACFTRSHCPPVLSEVLKYLPFLNTKMKITC